MNAVVTGLSPPGALSGALSDALSKALDDEFRARATYQAVIDAHGPVIPFANIVQAEQRHIDALLPLFYYYGVPLPTDRWAGNVVTPPSLLAACEAGVAGEIRNTQMYDALLQHVAEPDVRSVFVNLRTASAQHHLPAFQACAATATAATPVNAQPILPANPPTSSGMMPLALGLLAGVGLVWFLSQQRQSRAM